MLSAAAEVLPDPADAPKPGVPRPLGYPKQKGSRPEGRLLAVWSTPPIDPHLWTTPPIQQFDPGGRYRRRSTRPGSYRPKVTAVKWGTRWPPSGQAASGASPKGEEAGAAGFRRVVRCRSQAPTERGGIPASPATPHPGVQLSRRARMPSFSDNIVAITAEGS